MSLLIHSLLLTAIVSGQLIKIPIVSGSGITLLDLSVGIICLYGLFKSKLKFKKPSLPFFSGFIFIAIASASLIFSPLYLTPQERLISFSYTIRFSSYLFLGFLIHQNVIPVKVQMQKTLLFSGIILAILGILQFIFLPDLGFLQVQGWDPHFFRSVSTFLDPNFLGAYMVLTILLLKEVPITKKSFLTATLVYLTLLTTFSRGAYLAFLVAFLTLSLIKKSLKLSVLTILLFTGLMAGFFTYQHFVAGPKGVDRERSAQFRLGTWQQGYEIFEKNPFLGVGFNSYRYALKEYGLAGEQFLSSHGASSNDSSILFVASTTGILGLYAYLFWLGTTVKAAWKKNIILVAGLAGLLAQSFFANTLFYPPLLLWLILML